MGKESSDSLDLAVKVEGDLTGTGQSKSESFTGRFNVSVYGEFTAEIQMERSFDGGSTWVVCTDDSGNKHSWTSAISIIADEPEHNVHYRLNCTSYTSGTISYRISQ